MKKILFAALILSLFTGCGVGKYSDVKEYVDAVVACLENHSRKILAATTGEEMAAAISEYGDEMIALSKQGKFLYDKYPELQNDDTMPKRLVRQMMRIEKATNTLRDKISPHLDQFMDDPAVIQANIELVQKFNSIDFEEDMNFEE